jgi:hypothetical protein
MELKWESLVRWDIRKGGDRRWNWVSPDGYGQNIYAYFWCMSSMRRSIFRHSSRMFQGIGFCWWRFGVDFDFPKDGMWSKADGVLEKCPLHQ